MNRLNLLFFALLISFIHNFYSEFNTIFLQSFLFLFFSELFVVKIFNRCRRNQINQTNQIIQDDDSSVSDLEEDKKEEDKKEEKEETEDKKEETEDKEEDKKEETEERKDNSEETPEESEDTDGSSDEPVNITDGVDVNQMEILRLLNNYESLGDSGLMELKKKMLELDKLVEFYKNDSKKTKKE